MHSALPRLADVARAAQIESIRDTLAPVAEHSSKPAGLEHELAAEKAAMEAREGGVAAAKAVLAGAAREGEGEMDAIATGIFSVAKQQPAVCPARVGLRPSPRNSSEMPRDWVAGWSPGGEHAERDKGQKVPAKVVMTEYGITMLRHSEEIIDLTMDTDSDRFGLWKVSRHA
jgi:hypothetical protein